MPVMSTSPAPHTDTRGVLVKQSMKPTQASSTDGLRSQVVCKLYYSVPRLQLIKPTLTGTSRPKTVLKRLPPHLLQQSCLCFSQSFLGVGSQPVQPISQACHSILLMSITPMIC